MDGPLANAKVATEQPPWERGHQLLDRLSEEMRARIRDIEETVNRLQGEHDALQSVLGRIAPIPPPSINLPATPYPGSIGLGQEASKPYRY